MVTCNNCGRELTADESVVRGIGPICNSKMLEKIEGKQSKVCDYSVQFIDHKKVLIIHENYDPEKPTISLTNSIEFVIREIVEKNQICLKDWTIVEHSTDSNLFGGYDHYDLINTSGKGHLWKYLFHTDDKEEEQQFSHELMFHRIDAYKNGAKKVHNLNLPKEHFDIKDI